MDEPFPTELRGGTPGDDPVLARLREALGDPGFVEDGRVRPEREIAEALGVGRRAVRRALDALETEGLIWRRQGQGTFVSAPPAPKTRRFAGLAALTSPAEIMEVRLEIEPILARHAALRAAPVDVEGLRRLAERSRDAQSDAEYERYDGAFHRRIAEAMRNGLFLAVFEAIEAVREEPVWRRLREGTRPPERRLRLAGEHLAIVEAIAARSPDAAERAMREHLATIATSLGLPTGG
ncbi:FadR/GntR family transcriptional regulator [Salinarimonas ramus]|uniref:GntR family transcriptional regulator n=1 Tax=Salinarimonas ramus TaxID=690164 RepID=A0A917QBR0_9HYPH|nr:FCD domain-containing protein [Salinarimonas ramus]GGK41792.1 GntR family transcriptional regulator [Salinarimonas ramus]